MEMFKDVIWKLFPKFQFKDVLIFCSLVTAYHLSLFFQAFKTKDGYIVVGAGNDHQFVTVCKVR